MNSKLIIATCLAGLALTACGGSSGGTGSAEIKTETNELKNIAVQSLGGNFDGNAKAVGNVANRNADVLVGTLGDIAVGGTEELPAEINTDEVKVQENIQSLFSSSLATSESDNSTTTRTGNSISVDPDEVEMCSDSELFGEISAQERQQCETLMADVTVELLATSEETGVVTYKFKNQNVLKLGYGPDTEFSELDLGGLKAFVNSVSMVTDGVEAEGLPETMTGSFRFAATATNKGEGSEAGTIQYDIVNPIQIQSTTDEGAVDISMGAGNLFTVTADTATGAGSLSFDAGAISLAAPIDDTGIGRLNLAGFTGTADINPDSGQLVVSNLGLSKGPLSIGIDNTELLKVTLGAFGFRATEGTDLEPGEVIIDGNMDLGVIAGSLTDYEISEEVASAILQVMLPGGTSIARAGNGNARIGGVGPLSVSYNVVDDMGVADNKSATVNSGECFDDIFGTEAVNDNPFADTNPAPSALLCE